MLVLAWMSQGQTKWISTFKANGLHGAECAICPVFNDIN